MEIPSYLCPDSTKFELNQWLVDKTQKHIILKLTSKQTLVGCPGGCVAKTLEGRKNPVARSQIMQPLQRFG